MTKKTVKMIMLELRENKRKTGKEKTAESWEMLSKSDYGFLNERGSSLSWKKSLVKVERILSWNFQKDV